MYTVYTDIRAKNEEWVVSIRCDFESDAHFFEVRFLSDVFVRSLVLFSSAPDSWMRLVRLPASNRDPALNFHLLRHHLSVDSPVSSTYADLIRGYGELGAFSEGQLVHARFLMGDAEVHQIRFLENLLVQMYGKCGSIEDACSVFFKIPETDQFSWNLFLGACVQNDECDMAFQQLQQMQLEGFLPNKHTFLNILAACAAQESQSQGKIVHTHILNNGFISDLVLECAVVNMYGKCHNVEEARKMFDNMSEHNVISWNAMISTYAQQGQSRDALMMFCKMLQDGPEPSRVTFISFLDACASDLMLEEAMLMHADVVQSSFDSDSVIGTSLVNMYGKCGSLKDALDLFYKLPEKSVVTWNTMIGVSALYGQDNEAFELFTQMNINGIVPNRSTFVSMLSSCALKEDLDQGRHVHSFIIKTGISCDVLLATALVSMYGKCGNLKDARVIFDAIKICDAIAWTAMVSVYVQHDAGKEALSLIPKMPSGPVLVDSVTFVSILDACATEGALAEGRLMHILVLDSKFESDMVVGTALVNMYSKCANLEDAWSVFNRNHLRDVVAWNAMIAAHAQHGHVVIVLKLFYQMQLHVVPDDTTFVCILTACSHAGLVNEADGCVLYMKIAYGVSPSIDHYNCLLDLFGRSGWIDRSEKLIHSMPFQPSSTSWMTMLSTCRTHLDVLGGQCSALHVFEMKREFTAPYVVLSNLYAATGQLDVAERIRKLMKQGMVDETCCGTI